MDFVRHFIHFISGMVNDDLDFRYGSGLDIKQGCGVTIRGQFWYFGNHMSNRQVLFEIIILIRNYYFKAAKVVGCEMIRQSDLPFNFDRGSCNTFQVPEEKVLMCFSEDSRKSCHM